MSPPPTAAVQSLAAHARWSVSTPEARPLLRTDVYLCGDMVHLVARPFLHMSPPERERLHAVHWAKLVDLDTPWARLARLERQLTALSPYATGLGIVLVAMLCTEWVLLPAHGVSDLWWDIARAQLLGAVASALGALARLGVRWWIRHKVHQALSGLAEQAGPPAAT